MFRNRIGLGKVFGIPVKIDISWLLIFVLVTWSLAGSYFPRLYPEWAKSSYWLLGVITSVLFFASVLAHELGHSLVARAQGQPVTDITLFIFGGVSSLSDEPRSARDEALMAGVGPGVSIAVAVLCGVLYLLLRGVSQGLAAMTQFLAVVNASLAIFNLIPGFPLDGGRVLRALLWGARGDLLWATRWASYVGQGVSYLFILYGVFSVFSGNWLNGIWIGFIGLFLNNAALSSYQQVTLRNLLEGHTVSEIMTRNCEVMPPQLSVEEAVSGYLVGGARRCYTVGTREHVEGLLTVHNVREVPRDQWTTRRVRDIYTPLDKVRSVQPSTPLWDALREMTAEGVNQLPVMVDSELAGMLTRENLVTYIQNRSELGAA